jgi:hypothetical protein
MKLNAKQKKLLEELVKSKGAFKTPTINKDDTEKGFDDIVKLYLKGLLTFQRKYDIDLVGPSNAHMVRFKWYLITLDKSKTLKDIRSVIKAGQIA